MDVFLMIRRHNVTIFTDCKENTMVSELKRIIEGITKKRPEHQRLYKDDRLMDDSRCLADYDLTSSTARAQTPATVGLAFFDEEQQEFEKLKINPLSVPPELPTVMKPQDNQQDNENA